MDELLDLTEKTPRVFDTGPVVMSALSPEPRPLSVDRAADGTRTRIAIGPPPIPARARRASTTPPPIPSAAFRKPIVEQPVVEVEVDLSEARVDEVEAPPSVEAEYTPPSVLPPLPAPSASWLSTGTRRESQHAFQANGFHEQQPYAQQPYAQPPYAQPPYAQPPYAQPPYAQPPYAQPPYAQQPYAQQPYARPNDGDAMATSWFARASHDWTARHFAVVAIVAVALVSILYVAFSGGDKQPSPTQAAPDPAVAAVAPAPAPVVADPAPAAMPVVVPARPTVTSIPITSVPVGAVVTLVTDGNATVIGKTPVTASIDPAHSYDVVLAVRGQPTQIRHIDASTHEVAIDLTPRPAVTPHPVSAAVVSPHPATAPAPVRHTVVAPQPVRVASATPSAASPIMGGVLSLTTKPSCEIFVDGTSMHMVTPQRSISLSSGRHMITLTNSSLKIKKTIAVQIDARKPTTISQDFTHQ